MSITTHEITMVVRHALLVYTIKSYCAEESWTAAKTTTAARRMVVFIMPFNSRCCSEQVVFTRLFSLFAQSIQVKSVEEVASCRFYL